MHIDVTNAISKDHTTEQYFKQRTWYWHVHCILSKLPSVTSQNEICDF